jgi:hypothetical protein
MNVELYSGTGDFYQYTADQIVEFSRRVVGPFPAVVDNDQIIAVQPWDPSNDLAWASEEEAIAWGNQFITSYEAIQVQAANTAATRQSAIDKLIKLGLTKEEITTLLGPQR